MSTPPVRYEKDGTIATITLNRPENRNSMTRELTGAFVEAIAQARADAKLRALIVAGSGTTFCGGADFTELDRSGDTAALRERVFGVYQTFLSVLDVEVPVIAAMNGHAIGGGLGLALVCDLRIGSLGSRYGANFARLGIHSGMAISYLLPRIVGVPVAADLLFSGRVIDGARAAEIGLVNEAVSPDEVLAAARRRAEDYAAAAPIAVRLLKKTFYAGLDWNPRKAALMESWPQAATIGSPDADEGIAALLEKRPPIFRDR